MNGSFDYAITGFLLERHPYVGVLGVPASGKSTLLLKWGREALKRGWKVFALDEDTGALNAEFATPENVAEHLEGDVPVLLLADSIRTSEKEDAGPGMYAERFGVNPYHSNLKIAETLTTRIARDGDGDSDFRGFLGSLGSPGVLFLPITPYWQAPEG